VSHVGREHVFAVWLHAVFEPGHQVVEGQVPLVGAEVAVASTTDRPLNEQVIRTGREGLAPVVLL
jgi:hypothetical protein